MLKLIFAIIALMIGFICFLAFCGILFIVSPLLGGHFCAAMILLLVLALIIVLILK